MSPEGVFCGAGEAGLQTSWSSRWSRKDCVKRRRVPLLFHRLTRLVAKSRTDLVEHKLSFAQEGEFIGDLLAVISRVRPTVLIGASGHPGIFTSRSALPSADPN